MSSKESTHYLNTPTSVLEFFLGSGTHFYRNIVSIYGSYVQKNVKK